MRINTDKYKKKFLFRSRKESVAMKIPRSDHAEKLRKI